MKTKRLFDDLAFLKQFEAKVLSCTEENGMFAVILDQTAFFPEGGGQGADRGRLSGVEVRDVRELDGVIVHYLKEAIEGTVTGEIDWDTRFSRMQNHSGEHVLSGIIHRKTGADNISFSLTDTETTLAFDASLSDELLREVEREANAVVFADVPIRAWYPTARELAAARYRSKLALTQDVRLVAIEGVDLCACCAPHCQSTGQIGLIKILNSERYKGGTKLWIACGERALAGYEMLLEQAKEISHLLCAKINGIAPAVAKLKADKEKGDYELVSMRRQRIAEAVEQVPQSEGNYFALCPFRADDLRLFAEALKEKIAGFILVIEGDDTEGYRYVLTASDKDIGGAVKALNTALCGRGGGRDGMARGSFSAKKEEIERAFLEHLPREQ